jgi:hypothetical protein
MSLDKNLNQLWTKFNVTSLTVHMVQFQSCASKKRKYVTRSKSTSADIKIQFQNCTHGLNFIAVHQRTRKSVTRSRYRSPDIKVQFYIWNCGCGPNFIAVDQRTRNKVTRSISRTNHSIYIKILVSWFQSLILHLQLCTWSKLHK